MELKKRIKNCELRIEKLKQLNAPAILIQNEIRWLNTLMASEKDKGLNNPKK